MKNTKVIFTLFLAVCLLAKLYFIFSENPSRTFSADDQRNYTIARNYVAGKGYGIFDPMMHRYRLSAYHTSSTIFLYQFLIRKNVSQRSIAIGFFLLSTMLYLLAILFVYRILMLLGITGVLTYSATALFALYPSVLYAIGPMYHFDNLVMPLFIINFYYLLKLVRDRTLSLPAYSLLIASITLCCVLRTQVLFIYFFTGCFLLTVYLRDHFKHKRSGNAILYFLLILASTITIAYIPILKKNKCMFGAYIISTQSGFELLNGNNGITNGNWEISKPGDSLDTYAHQNIPNLNTLDEYTESKARGQLAWKWIRENPGLEIRYIFKKTARYFMPENASFFKQPLIKYHPFVLLVHLIFITGIITALLKKRKLPASHITILLLVPIAVTLLLSVIFFFDFRLRYYAEPFMIIMAAYLVSHCWRHKAGTDIY